MTQQKESFVQNEAAHNQGLLAASTDIISPTLATQPHGNHLLSPRVSPEFSLSDDHVISSHPGIHYSNNYKVKHFSSGNQEIYTIIIGRGEV